MPINNIAGYKFIALSELPELRAMLLEKCQDLAIKGTILLSPEGINMNLAGPTDNITLFKALLQSDDRFFDITFHESKSALQSFEFLKVKIKKEIITLRSPDIHPEIKRAPSITAQELKQWLDEGRDITLLDARNNYEVHFGTFKGAVNPEIDSFGAFPKAASTVNPNKPIVTFCTGGIRCEKAALHLLQEGFQQVFQLDKGILGYFKEIGSAHYDGECFVFYKSVAWNENQAAKGPQQCKLCHGPIIVAVKHSCISKAKLPAEKPQLAPLDKNVHPAPIRA